MKLRPLRDQVLVRCFASETTSAGGIVLPGSKSDKTFRGEVVATGNGAPLDNGETRPMQVNTGDKVWFICYQNDSNTLKVDGIDHIMITESEIVAVIEEE